MRDSMGNKKRACAGNTNSFRGGYFTWLVQYPPHSISDAEWIHKNLIQIHSSLFNVSLMDAHR